MAGAQAGSACLRGGDPAAGKNYAFYAPGTTALRQIMFHSTRASVQAAADARRTADPCGDAMSLAGLVVLNNLLSRTIRVPVLLLFGEKDALNRPAALALQRAAFPNATGRVLSNTGGALPLEASASTTRAIVAGWLCQRYAC